MALVTIDDLKAGMTLAADLLSPQGRLLAAAGTVLGEQHLRVCRIWGVSVADVAAGEAPGSDEPGVAPDPAILKAGAALGESRFLLADHSQAVTAKLSELFISRTVREALQRHHAVAAPPTVSLPPETTALKKLVLSDLQGADGKLASLPSIFSQVQEVLNNPRSSAAYIGEVISKDTSLTAKLLKLANSAFYGYPQKIETLSRAVTIVGAKQLTSLALGISVIQLFKDLPETINMEAFWKHSLACGIIARLLAKQGNRNLNEERFFVAGLLHDLGRLFMLKNYPQQAQAALQAAVNGQELLVVAENRIWGFNHAMIAGELFRIWKFPTTLEMAVRYHHQPLKAQSPLEPGLIHLADILAHSFALGNSGAWYIPPLEKEIWEMLALPENVLPVLAASTDSQLTEIYRVFFD